MTQVSAAPFTHRHHHTRHFHQGPFRRFQGIDHFHNKTEGGDDLEEGEGGDEEEGDAGLVDADADHEPDHFGGQESKNFDGEGSKNFDGQGSDNFGGHGGLDLEGHHTAGFGSSHKEVKPEDIPNQYRGMQHEVIDGSQTNMVVGPHREKVFFGGDPEAGIKIKTSADTGDTGDNDETGNLLKADDSGNKLMKSDDSGNPLDIATPSKEDVFLGHSKSFSDSSMKSDNDESPIGVTGVGTPLFNKGDPIPETKSGLPENLNLGMQNVDNTDNGESDGAHGLSNEGKGLDSSVALPEDGHKSILEHMNQGSDNQGSEMVPQEMSAQDVEVGGNIGNPKNIQNLISGINKHDSGSDIFDSSFSKLKAGGQTSGFHGSLTDDAGRNGHSNTNGISETDLKNSMDSITGSFGETKMGSSNFESSDKMGSTNFGSSDKMGSMNFGSSEKMDSTKSDLLGKDDFTGSFGETKMGSNFGSSDKMSLMNS